MSNLDDPRVLFAAERTLLAWSRTALGVVALGFLVDRTEILLPSHLAHSKIGVWVGLAFILVGVGLAILSALQYRRIIATLRPVEIPAGYWLNLPVWMNVLIASLGSALALYLLLSAR